MAHRKSISHDVLGRARSLGSFFLLLLLLFRRWKTTKKRRKPKRLQSCRVFFFARAHTHTPYSVSSHTHTHTPTHTHTHARWVNTPGTPGGGRTRPVTKVSPWRARNIEKAKHGTTCSLFAFFGKRFRASFFLFRFNNNNNNNNNNCRVRVLACRSRPRARARETRNGGSANRGRNEKW